MRRGLASLIVGLSLMLATLSWAGFTLSRTVLDPGRSERLADQLLENPDVRQALIERLSDALEAQIPQEIPVPRDIIEAGAERAIDQPSVENLIRDGFVQVHQNALAGNSDPVVVDASALGSAGRDALVDARPELGAFLPQTPALEMELPTTGLTWLGSVKKVVDRFTGPAAAASVLGLVTAFTIARDRARIFRRAAYWGYGASAFWLAVGYGIPWIAGFASPTSAALATAAADLFFGAMIAPAAALAVVATAMLIVGFLLPGLQRQRGAAVLQPRRQPTPTTVAPIRHAPEYRQPPIYQQPPPYQQTPTYQQPQHQQPQHQQPQHPQPQYQQPPIYQQPRAAGQPPEHRQPPHQANPPHDGTQSGDTGQTGPPGGRPGQSEEPWRPVGSTDTTDPMPIPTWDRPVNR